MTTEEQARKLLDLELPDNDANALTVRQYLTNLVSEVWKWDEGFSGKRPFGNSDWKWDIYGPMVKAEFVAGEIEDEWGYVISRTEQTKADVLILLAIELMGKGEA